MKYYIHFIVLLALTSACVPQRKLTEEQARNTRLKSELQTVKQKLANYVEENGQLSDRMVDMEKELRELLERTESAVTGFKRLKQQNTDLNELYDRLINQNKDLLSTSSAQNQKLKLELESKKRELERKESKLSEKQISIDELRSNLEIREKRVAELEGLLSQKESAVNELRDKLTQALLGFDEEELSVEIKNGKKVTVERKVFPGYVLVEMVMNQNTMHIVNGIQGVIKFVGQGWTPQAIRQEEVNRLLGIEEETEELEPKEEIPFMGGQVVEIVEGPFSEFSGTVEQVLPDKGKVRVSVSLFGRPTTVELDYLQLKAH